jgi:signal transduction histidine kinase
LVWLVARLHRGSVTVESDATQGTRFTLRLPVPASWRR